MTELHWARRPFTLPDRPAGRPLTGYDADPCDCSIDADHDVAQAR